jgi:hypothetical protein
MAAQDVPRLQIAAKKKGRCYRLSGASAVINGYTGPFAIVDDLERTANVLGGLGAPQQARNETPSAHSVVDQSRGKLHVFRAFTVALAISIVTTAVISLVGRGAGPFSPKQKAPNYRALACTERIVREPGNFYRPAQLRRCEHGVGLEPGEPKWAARPFALPPYSASLLLPFALLYLPRVSAGSRLVNSSSAASKEPNVT